MIRTGAMRAGAAVFRQHYRCTAFTCPVRKENQTMKRVIPFLILLLMLPVQILAQVSAVPQLMNFQGRLTRPDGTPVANGNYAIRFSFWTAVTGGTEKWSQT